MTEPTSPTTNRVTISEDAPQTQIEPVLENPEQLLPCSGDVGFAENPQNSQNRRSLLMEELVEISQNYSKRKKSALNQRRIPKSGRERIYKPDDNEFGPLPPSDYYHRTDILESEAENVSSSLDDDDDEGDDEDPKIKRTSEVVHYTPMGRNAVEMGNKFYLERNLFSYLANTTVPCERNYFDDADVDESYLDKKPCTCLLLGKPGVGKTTLAVKLAKKLNAVLISPEEALEYYKDDEEFKIQMILDSGGGVRDKLVLELIRTRVEEVDVMTKGYVLDGFPITNSEEVSIEEQIELLESLTFKPRFVLLIHMQDCDLYKRRIVQKYDPVTNIIYGPTQYSKLNPEENVFPIDPPNKTFKKVVGAGHEDEDEEESELLGETGSGDDETLSVVATATTETQEEEKKDEDEEEDDHLDGSRDFLPLTYEILFRLVYRTKDNPMLVDDDLERFRDALPGMQGYIEKLDKRTVLELNGYFPPSVVFRRAYEFLEACGVTPSPKYLEGEEEEGQPNLPQSSRFSPPNTAAVSRRVGAEDVLGEDQEVVRNGSLVEILQYNLEEYLGEEETGRVGTPAPFHSVDPEIFMDDREILSPLQSAPEAYLKVLKEIESLRCFGDLKYFCPVTFAEKNLLRKGSPDYACKFRDRFYYGVDEEHLQMFLDNPTKYLPEGRPFPPPPPRLIITGSPFCGQERVALSSAQQHSLYYIDFRQQLHELLRARLGREVGPNKTFVIIQRYDTERELGKASSGDDLIEGKGKVVDNTRDDYEDDTYLDETDGGDEKEEETSGETLSALESLGLLETEELRQGQLQDTLEYFDGSRNERLIERQWRKLTKMETHIKAFLENGIQLPESALDELIAPLWKEKKYREKGFILVGFPNSAKDVEYMGKRDLVPELLLIMHSQDIVMNNRIRRSCIEKWHLENDPKDEGTQGVVPEDSEWEGERESSSSTGSKDKAAAAAAAPQQKKPRWSYTDKISANISTALKYYHGLYSVDLNALKISLNKHRIDWASIGCDPSFSHGQRRLREELEWRLQYRSSVFEDTVRLTMKEANTLLGMGVFLLSKFRRWCPVEFHKGNTALNMWNSNYEPKIPILYRRYIYFLYGEKNAREFERNCEEIVRNPEQPMSTVPSIVVVMGPPKSGKTTLARNLSKKLGLVYISGSSMMEDIIKHSFVPQFEDVLHEIEPKLLEDCPQPMLLAEEILMYLRSGGAVPRFMLYRVLDVMLQEPKAQYHGVVFDDYPVLEDQLQELLYRGVVPSTVIKLNVTIDEALRRRRKLVKPEHDFYEFPQDGDDALITSTDTYHSASRTALDWFQTEVQNAVDIDGNQSPEFIYQQAAQLVKNNTKKMQNYLLSVLSEKASILDGTCPLTSQIPSRLSLDFGYFCPVSLNDDDELVTVSSATNLSQTVEYKGAVYVFASEGKARKFVENPENYTPPLCRRLPPKDMAVSCSLTPNQFEELKAHWGLVDFDPVLFYNSGHQYKGLQRGSPTFVAAHKDKVYCFVSEENMKEFIRHPEKYENQTTLLPAKLPKRPEPLDLDKIPPYVYLLTTGVISQIKNVIRLTGDTRPKIPFLNRHRCAALFMGYYLKSQNMKAPYELRKKYRDAMFDMSQQKGHAKNFYKEIKNIEISESMQLSDELKAKVDEFMEIEQLTDGERMAVPKLKGMPITSGKIRMSREYGNLRIRTKLLKFILNEEETLEKYKSLSNALFEKTKEVLQLDGVDETKTEAVIRRTPIGKPECLKVQRFRNK